MESNCDLLGLSGNREKHLPVRNEKKVFNKLSFHFFSSYPGS